MVARSARPAYSFLGKISLSQKVQSVNPYRKRVDGLNFLMRLLTRPKRKLGLSPHYPDPPTALAMPGRSSVEPRSPQRLLHASVTASSTPTALAALSLSPARTQRRRQRWEASTLLVGSLRLCPLLLGTPRTAALSTAINPPTTPASAS